MAFKQVIGQVSDFMVTADVLAAIGARLGVDEDQVVDPAVVAALDDVLAAAGVPSPDDLDPEERVMLRNGIRSFFREAADLVDNATRPPGYVVTDRLVLDGQGQASMRIPSILAGAAPELATVSCLLDVGVGAGWLSIAATSVWPQCAVVGIDTWEPAIEHARKNVAAAGLGHRISLRVQDVVDLGDAEAYDCAWVPGSFLPERVLPMALSKVVTAVRPGGWVVLGRYDNPASDPMARTTMALRAVRDGGSNLDGERWAQLLVDAGCVNVRPLPRTWRASVAFVIGQRPPSPEGSDQR